MSQETRTRILFGVIAALILVSILFFGGSSVILGTCLCVSAIAWHEYAKMTNLIDSKLSYYFGASATLYLVFLNSHHELELVAALIVGLLALVVLAIESRCKKIKQESPMLWKQWIHLSAGVFYPVFLFGYITPISKWEAGSLWIFFGFMVVFFGDTAAYIVGRRIGKHKIWPEASPGKTLEGALGGILGSSLAAIICSLLFAHFYPEIQISTLKLVLFALIAAPLAQLGDFLESLLKRSTGTKDSGTLIPGHGGILDRCDGMLFVFVVLYQVFSLSS